MEPHEARRIIRRASSRTLDRPMIRFPGRPPSARVFLLGFVAILVGCLGPTQPSTLPIGSPGPSQSGPSGTPEITPTPVPGAPTAGPPGPSIMIPPPIR